MITIEKAEKELAELQDIFKLAETKIRETGGQKSQLWVFYTRSKIYDLKEKIKDLKADTIRTDELPPETMEVEERVARLKGSLAEADKGKEQICL